MEDGLQSVRYGVKQPPMETGIEIAYVEGCKGKMMQVRVKDYPQLEQLCWNRPADAVLDGADALAIYERNWRFVVPEALTVDERRMLDTLVARYGNGAMNV
ncbi:hypothetical protein [Maricaulis maris]|uniref:Uncharacterized protein n=1 Tax=Maricaulis maris TaxID=74318 RepID=A0A495DJW9_9PROT|nr:hypothetical protein [Maricaulis maris]RKR02924.1 hypothetical protein C7435_0869 [Maricaulis maris]